MCLPVLDSAQRRAQGREQNFLERIGASAATRVTQIGKHIHDRRHLSFRQKTRVNLNSPQLTTAPALYLWASSCGTPGTGRSSRQPTSRCAIAARLNALREQESQGQSGHSPQCSRSQACPCVLPSAEGAKTVRCNTVLCIKITTAADNPEIPQMRHNNRVTHQ